MSKTKGYLEFDDSKAALLLFEEIPSDKEDKGYELTIQFNYGMSIERVEEIIGFSCRMVDIENLGDIFKSDKIKDKFI